MARTYVPGYGYVDSGDSGTTGSVKKGPKRRVTGQEPRRPTTPTGGQPVTGDYWNTRNTGAGGAGGSVVTTSSGSPQVPAYLRYDIAYRPPVWGTADRMEREIPGLPLIYRAQTSGDLREAYWGDPQSKAIIQAAAREYYKDYPNYSDQWAEGFWQKDILNAAINPGSPPAWQMLQDIFSGQVRASEAPDGSGRYTSYGSGGGYGGGGGGGGGSVALTDPTSARGLLMQTMQGALGRNPTNQEYSQFLKILNEAEMANPRTVGVEGNLAVQSGGVDPGVLALDFAKDQEDWQERQGDQYFQVFMQSLAGGV